MAEKRKRLWNKEGGKREKKKGKRMLKVRVESAVCVCVRERERVSSALAEFSQLRQTVLFESANTVLCLFTISPDENFQVKNVQDLTLF